MKIELKEEEEAQEEYEGEHFIENLFNDLHSSMMALVNQRMLQSIKMNKIFFVKT